MTSSTKLLIPFLLIVSVFLSCGEKEETLTLDDSEIIGYSLLEELSGHWVGSNETAFGNYPWFSFDFRPISPSYVHSIYEGGTKQNIITSIFLADFEGRKQIMARNGGWLGNGFRATYFVLDKAENSGNTKSYRLVDAVGGVKRTYIEFRFEEGTMYFDAYKDNFGALDEPIKHMAFKGTNYNPSFAQPATDLFSFPQQSSEINLEHKFDNSLGNLIDPDAAMFIDENTEPFPKSQHGYLSDLSINFNRSFRCAKQSASALPIQRTTS